MAEAASPAHPSEKVQKVKPEKPDEEKFKAEHAQAERELVAAQEKLVWFNQHSFTNLSFSSTCTDSIWFPL